MRNACSVVQSLPLAVMQPHVFDLRMIFIRRVDSQRSAIKAVDYVNMLCPSTAHSLLIFLAQNRIL